MTTVADITQDLADEHAELDTFVAALTPEQWANKTPSPGWTIADQIGHLGYFDRTAALAINDPDEFSRQVEEFLDEAATAGFDITLSEPRSMEPDQLLEWWRAGRHELVTAAASLDDATRVRWYGPSMGAKSFLTARLMEAWAHGQDIADALEVEREPMDRLRHIAQLGVITRGWSYINRGLEPNTEAVEVSLTAPSGDIWVWGDDEDPDTITGSALEFCQVVTQRRHVDDTDLEVLGPAAVEWMAIAQAFAGGATDGPAAGTFV